MSELVTEDNHLYPEAFHGLGKGGDGILYGLCQLPDCGFQLPQQGVVRLDLSVDFTAVRDDSLFLQRTGSHTLMDGGLLVQPPVSVTTVVDPCIDPRMLRQILVGYLRPFFPPD